MQAEIEKMRKDILSSMDRFSTVLECSMTKSAHQTSLERETYVRMQEDCARKDAYIKSLEEQIACLKDENKSFMSVSTIVALTNENAKLKQVINGLERSMFRRSEAAIKPPVEATAATAATAAPSVDIETATETATADATDAVDEKGAGADAYTGTDADAATATTEVDSVATAESNSVADEYHEKIIKGKAYYIDAEGVNIYENDGDGGVGDIVGQYVTGKDGKRKIRWSAA
jgi:hypothetical protein